VAVKSRQVLLVGAGEDFECLCNITGDKIN
jgi:hypothetical protein